MTGVQYLQLYGCSLLTDVSFAKNMPDLKELDIRGTGIVDMSPLDNYIKQKGSTKLQTIVIDNPSMDMTKMQTIINKINHGSHDYSSWVGYSYINYRAIMLIGEGYDFSRCTEITKWDSANALDSGTIDLTGCTNLREFYNYGSKRSYILPSGLTSYFSRSKTRY